MPMRYLESHTHDAYYNMALEEYVFEAMPKNDEYFLLWQNANAVVVGKYQNTAAEIDDALVREHDVAVVRRLSGGGAMYQDLGNLNFTFIVNQGAADFLDFSIFIMPVISALADMGVKAEYNSRNDITVQGKKVSGNAQYNKGSRTMHHGTLLFDSDLGMLDRVLRPPPDKIESKGIKSVRSRVANIREYLPQDIDLAQFKSTLLKRMFAINQLTPCSLSEEDLSAIESLREQKYATWDWNYGRNPVYNQCKERRYPFGKINLLMDVEKGHIRGLDIFGDFFGNGEISELTEKLIGQALYPEAIRSALAGLDTGYYIAGMDAETLTMLITN